MKEEGLSQPEGSDGAKQSDEVLLNVIRPDYERPLAPPPMEPLYQPGEDGKVQGNVMPMGPGCGGWGPGSFRLKGRDVPETRRQTGVLVVTELVVVSATVSV